MRRPKKILILLLIILLAWGWAARLYLNWQDSLEIEKKYREILRQGLIVEQKEKEERLKNYLMGNFDPSKRKDFAPVPAELNLTGNTIYLRKETLQAFIAMERAAKNDGISLKLASATRNFDYQKMIWNRKWIGATLVDGKDLSVSFPNREERFNKILEYSAVPGTSRHHWGTDIDINDANPAYFNRESGKRVYEWLTKNAPSFGFCQPYNATDDLRSTGYNEEKWHWSYLPLAREFTREYGSIINEEDIKGFYGDETAKTHNLIKDYVLGINPDCL